MLKKKSNFTLHFMSLLLIICLLAAGMPSEANASSTGAWVLVKTDYNTSNNANNWTTIQPERLGVDHTYALLKQGQMQYFSLREANPSSNATSRRNMVAVYSWNAPPSIIQSGENLTITVNRDVQSSSEGGWYGGLSNQVSHGWIGANRTHSVFTAPDCLEYTTAVFASASGAGSRALNTLLSLKADHQFKFAGAGQVDGNEQQIVFTFLSATFLHYERYTYEWQEGAATPTPQPQPAPAPSTGSRAEVFDSGTRLEWPAIAGLGYRVFRSTNSRQLGISITDFYITTTRIVDVNVEPNTEYHYTVKPVLAEARPLQGVDERLGENIATFTIRTAGEITNVGQQKGFIILQLDNPIMIVNGVSQEIDPGRGTTPIIISGRSMVPIRAIVEAMSGTMGWDGSESKITLDARGNMVEMWLNRNDIRSNGTNARMDVAPVPQGDRTFVPVRFASENLNAKADWINSTREVVIVYTQ